MRTLPPATTTQAALSEQAPTLLVAISGWLTSVVRWAHSDADVVVGSDTYTARPFTVSQLTVGLGGQALSLTLTVSNQDLYVSQLCAQADPRGATVTVYRVFLDDVNSIYTFADSLEITSYTLTEKAAMFRCSVLGKYLKKRVPLRTFDRTCPWEFKGPECGYTGAATSCDHTDETCKSYNNFANFGGFLFVIPKR